MRPPLRAAIALAALLPAQGCCGISQSLVALFCGPRKEPWNLVDFTTPERALRTFTGAIARDDIDVIYRCLGLRFKQKNKIGEVEWQIAWEAIKKKVTGIHTLDQAEVSAPVVEDERHVRYVLTTPTTPSYRIQVRLVREDYWRVVLYGAGGELEETSRVVPRLAAHVALVPRAGGTGVRVNLPGPDIPGVEVDEIQKATAERLWKIDGIGMAPPEKPKPK